MQVDIEYSGRKIPVKVDEERVLDILAMRPQSPCDEGSLLRKAVEPIRGFIKEGLTVVLVNDHTRHVPNDRVLELMLPHLAGRQVKYLVASGTHRKPNQRQLEQIFGSVFGRVRDSISFHDCRKDLVTLGTTTRGTTVKVNRLVTEAERVVTINSVQPHYFAGFSGGRKSIVPGVAGYDTIEQNHRLAMDAGSQDIALDGNPVHEDLTEAALLLKKPVFSVQLVLEGDRIVAAESGGLEDSFMRAVCHARRISCSIISDKAGIVVAVAPHPKDIDLYQSQQALEKGKLALKEGGILILVANCGEGIGDEQYFRLLSGSKNPDDIIKAVDNGYRLGYHKAAKIAQLAKKSKICLVSSLDSDVVRKCFMEPYTDVQTALDEALRKDKEAKVTFLLNGFNCVPTQKNGT
jgi:lactate racemase